jgi:hypothetical protein
MAQRLDCSKRCRFIIHRRVRARAARPRARGNFFLIFLPEIF